MIGRVIRFCIKEYFEIFLYLCLLASLILHKIYNLPNLSPLVLLSPMLFKDIRMKDRWLLLWFFYPFVFLLGFEPIKVINLTLFAFAEEVFFRAYLMQRYGNFLVSLMFVLPHLILYQNLQALLTFFPSLAYGYIYSKTKSINLASFLHFLSNIFYFLVIGY